MLKNKNLKYHTNSSEYFTRQQHMFLLNKYGDITMNLSEINRMTYKEFDGRVNIMDRISLARGFRDFFRTVYKIY